mgnify:FL=1|jgi:hypothetical protein
MSGLFWSNVNTDPKRRFRFILTAGNIPIWTIKTVTKPAVTVGTVEHQFLNHTFKYPGRVTWNNITMTLVDPVDPDLAFTFLDKLRKSGYDYPTSDRVRGTINKKDAAGVQGIGGVSIAQIDAEGREIEKWKLTNPFIVNIDFGGNLDYAADEMNEISVEIAYDWAELVTKGKVAR